MMTGSLDEIISITVEAKCTKGDAIGISEFANCDKRSIEEQRQEGNARNAEPEDLACTATPRKTIELFRPASKGNSGIGGDCDPQPTDGAHGSPLTTFIECRGQSLGAAQTGPTGAS